MNSSISRTINEKVLICGICRNVASTLSLTLNKIIETGSLFKDYHIVIYENNSTDQTKAILTDFAINHPAKSTVMSEDLNEQQLLEECYARTWNNKPSRMEVIAMARNKVLEKIFQPEFEGYEYVMWVDLDLYDWNLAGIENSFSYKNWDCISANGIGRNGKYNDAYAYRDDRFPFGPEVLGDYWWSSICGKVQKPIRSKELIPVYSAFGGLALYKKDSIRNIRYSGVVIKDLHLLLKDKILARQDYSIMGTVLKNIKKVKCLHGVLRSISLFGDDVFYVNNSGYNFPVVCEHVVFHAAMIQNGFDKIFVNPKMIIRYP